MKKTIYLHIGTFKTGTSSIQDAVYKGRKELKNEGFLVPESQLIGPHELPLSLIKDYTKFRAHWPSFNGGSKDIWGGLLDQIEASDCNRIIISSEMFCDLANEHCRAYFEILKSKLNEYLGGYNVKVICYVRSILPYLQSRYAETLKVSPNTQSFEEQCSAFLHFRSIHVYPSEYLRFYEEVFGKNNLIVKEYSVNKLLNENVVDDFLNLIGVTNYGTISGIAIRRNPSIPCQEIDKKRLFNLAGCQDYNFNNLISDLLIKSHNISRHKAFDVSAIFLEKLKDEIELEQQFLSDDYGLVFDKPDLSEEARQSVSDEDGNNYFITTLMALMLRQNRELQNKNVILIDKINDLSKKMDVLINRGN